MFVRGVNDVLEKCDGKFPTTRCEALDAWFNVHTEFGRALMLVCASCYTQPNIAALDVAAGILKARQHMMLHRFV